MTFPEQLAAQLSNPRHVYLEVGGDFLRHHETYQDENGNIAFFKGEKIRFTRLAAERLMVAA